MNFDNDRNILSVDKLQLNFLDRIQTHRIPRAKLRAAVRTAAKLINRKGYYPDHAVQIVVKQQNITDEFAIPTILSLVSPDPQMQTLSTSQVVPGDLSSFFDQLGHSVDFAIEIDIGSKQ